MKTQANRPPIDDQVQVPAAIRAAALRSEELHRQMYPTEEPTAAEDDKVEKAPEVAAEGTTEEKVEEKTAKPDGAKPDGAKPDGAKPDGVKAEEPGTESDDPKLWEHRYNSIKGRYDRQEQTIKSLNSRISQLEALLAKAPKQEEKPARTPDQTYEISDEERETYGEDFLDVASRAAASRLNPLIGQLQSQIEEMRGTVTSVAQKTAEDKTQAMYSLLDSEVPNWRDVNRDQNFIAWCNLPDPFSGVIRMDMLREAYAKVDGRRVSNFFKGFLADEAVTDPAGSKPETPKQGKVPLESFAAPGRAKAPAAAPRPGEKETISTAQIAQFYADVNRGKYKGNDAEKNRLEAIIFSAQAEGRVVA